MRTRSYLCALQGSTGCEHRFSYRGDDAPSFHIRMANAVADTWDDYFIGIAQAVSAKSKDPRSKVGAIIVDPDRIVLSTGFNGFPRGVEDDEALLSDQVEKLDWVIHAEHNAILNAARLGITVAACTLYVNKFPCFKCLQVIIQAGIKRVYTSDKTYWANDPQDKDHERKRYLIRVSGMKVDAPNHPSFRPGPPRRSELPGTVRKATETAQSERTGASPDAATSDVSRNR